MQINFICINPYDSRHSQLCAGELHRAIELKFFHALKLHIWMRNKFSLAHFWKFRVASFVQKNF